MTPKVFAFCVVAFFVAAVLLRIFMPAETRNRSSPPAHFFTSGGREVWLFNDGGMRVEP